MYVLKRRDKDIQIDGGKKWKIAKRTSIVIMLIRQNAKSCRMNSIYNPLEYINANKHHYFR